MIPFKLQAFHLAKQGNTEAEYEDAVAHDAERGRFAVADGATESAFAGLWARIVVGGFVAAPTALGGRDWLSTLRQQWHEAVPWSELPWYGQEKARLGSFCTCLGIWFAPAVSAPGGRWRAAAIGDCCLFQVRNQDMIRAFPIAHSSEFGNRPRLLRSLATPSHRWPRGLKGIRGTWQAADLFVLGSDALAQWCLLSVEAGRPPWPMLQRLRSQEEFAAWVGELRAQGQMRNDDVSVLILEAQDELA